MASSNIFLIGMMGSGKSYWAKQLSHQLLIPNFDLDNIIEEIEQASISTIFEKRGEGYFREQERTALRSFEYKNSFILATGGGTPCFNNNIEWMNKNGITIWINESIPTILERLLKEQSHRPLIKNLSQDELQKFLELKLEERKPYYSKAKLTLNSKKLNNSSILNELLKAR